MRKIILTAITLGSAMALLPAVAGAQDFGGGPANGGGMRAGGAAMGGMRGGGAGRDFGAGVNRGGRAGLATPGMGSRGGLATGGVRGPGFADNRGFAGRGYGRNRGGVGLGVGLGLAGAAVGYGLGNSYGAYDGPYVDQGYAPPEFGAYGGTAYATPLDDDDDAITTGSVTPAETDNTCAQRFRSYDPASGTYLGYDGKRHPCS